MWRRLQSFLPILAGTLMIMLVVLLNGGPSVFTDTDDYYVEGRTFAVTIADFVHLHVEPPPSTDPDDIADAKEAAADLQMSHTEIGARSPYYGLLLYVTQRAGTIWLTTLVQGLVGAWLTFLLWRTCLPRARQWTAYAAEAAVAFGSTLPFFAAFTMPDVFGGYTAAAEILLLVFWDRLAVSERVGLAFLTGLAITFHTSQLLNSVGVLVLVVGLYRLLKTPKGIAVASGLAVGAAMICAVMAVDAYKEGVKLKTGDELRRPPFLAMRVLADGPGRDYLKDACHKNPTQWALCPFAGLPLDNSQDLLWSDDRRKGIFNVTTLETRLRMEKEENAFVLHAVAYDPLGQVIASIGNWGEQFLMPYVDDPIKNPHYYLTNAYWSTTNLPILINRARDCGRDHWGCGFRLSIDGSIWLHGSLLVLGLILMTGRVGLAVLRHRSPSWNDPLAPRRGVDWDDEEVRLSVALTLLVAVVFINAFVCGAMSGPFPRYQARLTWLVTAGGALSLISLAPEMAVFSWREALARFLALGPVTRFRAMAPVAAVERRFDPAFLRFGMVGAVGFAVDYVVLHSLVSFAHVDPRAARFVSFPVAVVATWLLNRSFTFRAPAAHGPARQAMIYAAVQGAGGVANVGVYLLALKLFPVLNQALIIPLAFGSAAGLCLTFVGSKRFAFKPAQVLEVPQAPDEPHEAVETGT